MVVPTSANVTAGSYNPSASGSSSVTATPGVAQVTVAAPGPTSVVGALASVATVTVTGLQPRLAVVPGSGVASVTVTANGVTQGIVTPPTVLLAQSRPSTFLAVDRD
jgi:hypothetical protein